MQNKIQRRIRKQKERGFVVLAELFEQDKKLRREYGILPRGSKSSLYYFLWVNRDKIRHEKIRHNLNMYHLLDAIDALTEQYGDSKRGMKCRMNTHASISASHLEATPAILSNPDYQPRSFLLKNCRISADSIKSMVTGKIILPYWDARKRRLLYPVRQTIERSFYRPLKAIKQLLGVEYAEHIKNTRPSITWQTDIMTGVIYYCPECPRKEAHL